jgi:hypothetical protein
MPSASIEPVAASVMPANPTVADIWLRYRTLKEPSWSTATRKAVVSVFETAPPTEGPKSKPRRPSVLQMIGSLPVISVGAPSDSTNPQPGQPYGIGNYLRVLKPIVSKPGIAT